METQLAPGEDAQPTPQLRRRKQFRHREVATVRLLPKDLLAWRDRYAEHLLLTAADKGIVTKRRAWCDEFLTFLSFSGLTILRDDNAFLTRQFSRHLEAQEPFNRTRVLYRYMESCKFINFVTAFQRGTATMLPKEVAPKGRFRLNERGPRDEGMLRKILGYDTVILPSEQAKTSFDSLFRTVVDHLLSYRASAKAWNSYRGAEQDLKTFLRFIADAHAWMPASAINKSAIEQFLLWCEENGKTPASIRRYLNSVRRLLRDVPGMDPMVFSVKGPGKTFRLARPMNLEDALDVIKHVDPAQSFRALQNKTILYILLGCGLRISEVISMRPRDLVRERNSRRVRANIPHTKNKREHIVELPPQAVPLLDEIERIQKKNGRPDTYFLNYEGHSTKVVYETFRKDFKALLAELGLDVRTRIHSLRATFVTLLLSRGVPREKVQAAINQAHPSSLNPYDGFTGKDVDHLIRQHHPLFDLGSHSAHTNQNLELQFPDEDGGHDQAHAS